MEVDTPCERTTSATTFWRRVQMVARRSAPQGCSARVEDTHQRHVVLFTGYPGGNRSVHEIRHSNKKTRTLVTREHDQRERDNQDNRRPIPRHSLTKPHRVEPSLTAP